MSITLERAHEELHAALAGPAVEVFPGVVAISERMLRDGLSTPELESWAAAAARGILERGIPPEQLTCYDALDPRLAPLIFHLADLKLAARWPARPLSHLYSIVLGEADIDWRAMPDCEWPLLRELLVVAGSGTGKGLLSWLARQRLPALRVLAARNLDATPEADLALARASFWPQLEEIVLWQVKLGGRGAWTPMPRARHLELQWTRSTADDLRILTSVPLPALAVLKLSGNRLGNEGFDVLRGTPLPALERLETRGCYFEDGHAWRTIAQADWPRLRHLDLHDSVRASDDLRAAAPVLRRLETLSLSSSGLDERAAAALAALELPALTSLDLSYSALTPAAGAALAGAALPALRELQAPATPLGDAGVAALVRAPWWARLEVVNLANAELTDAALRSLTAAVPSTLRELTVIPSNHLSSGAIDALRAALPPGARLD